MARCQCAGSGACSCVIVPGPGISVSGNGGAATPYTVGARISTDAGNNITLGTDGGLFSAAGGAASALLDAGAVAVALPTAAGNYEIGPGDPVNVPASTFGVSSPTSVTLFANVVVPWQIGGLGSVDGTTCRLALRATLKVNGTEVANVYSWDTIVVPEDGVTDRSGHMQRMVQIALPAGASSLELGITGTLFLSDATVAGTLAFDTPTIFLTR